MVKYKSINDKKVKIKSTDETRVVTGEYDSNVLEIIQKKKTIIDATAVVYANAVLMNSKLHILKFINMMLTYWDTTAFKLVYSGGLSN